MIPPEVHRQTLFALLEPLRSELEDPTVSEILVNGPSDVFVERRGLLERAPARFPSASALDAFLRNLAQFTGRFLDAEHPVLEGHLPDGSRVEAVIPPASPEGPCVAIRRFPRARLTVKRLVEAGALEPETARLLADLVAARKNIVLSGGTGSGKTSLLAALSSFIGPAERVVVLEDARELELLRPHVVRLLTCPGDVDGRGRVTLRDLLRAALRMRPDRLVVGEVRGVEAIDLVQAMTSGHGGSMSTLHASHPQDALRRLETMALLGGAEIPLAALRAQIASAVDIVVQVTRLPTGARTVTHVSEVVGVDPAAGYRVRDLYSRAT